MTQIQIKHGQSIAFLGASVTEDGWHQPTGYLRLIVETLTQSGINVTPYPAGRGGHTSRDMLARLDDDVIRHYPDWMTLDAGRNDVWHGSVTFAEYMRNMTTIVDRAQAAGIRVMLQTITPIGEDPDSEFAPQLAYFNDFVRYLAAHQGCLLTDLAADFHAVLQAKTGTDLLLTTDGTHMNERGNQLMARGLLRTLGLTDAQIAKTICLAT